MGKLGTPVGNTSLTRFDVLIIGSGAGGSAVAHLLTKAGKKVLILEAGSNHFKGLDGSTALSTNFANDELKFGNRRLLWPDGRLEPRSWRKSTADGDRREVGDLVWLPKTVGGGAVVADLKTPRFLPQDFHLGTALGGMPGTSWADWPVDYDALEPYYAYAEKMMGVQGAPTPFDGPRSTPYPMANGVPMYGALKVAAGARSLGYTAEPFPAAVNSRPYDGRPACNDCGFCTSYGCPTSARGTPPVTALRKALSSGNALLIPETRAVKLLTNGAKNEVTGVEAIGPDGERVTYTADQYVLAATAIEDARLLFLSGDGDALGNSSDQVGRNLTFHLHTPALGVFDERLHGHRGRTVGHGIWDFRGKPNDPDHPLGGIVEISLNSDPLGESEYYRKIVSLFGGYHPGRFKKLMQQSPGRDRVVALAMVGEDAPQPTNRVDLDPALKDVDGIPSARITYQSHEFELAVSQFYTPKLLDVLMAAGARYAIPAPLEELAGNSTSHMHGTLRSGNDPRTSVTDKDGRFHDVGNLLAADGSLFPTAGGFNPTLTIVALALHVGAALVSPTAPETALS
jgi:gluconate 2-dehydrogenase alpha chain